MFENTFREVKSEHALFTWGTGQRLLGSWGHNASLALTNMNTTSQLLDIRYTTAMSEENLLHGEELSRTQQTLLRDTTGGTLYHASLPHRRRRPLPPLPPGGGRSELQSGNSLLQCRIHTRNLF